AYLSGIVIYHSEEIKLSVSDFKNKINDIQKRLINNIYTKRLSSAITEDIAKIILKENNASNLKNPFINLGSDFNFFDNNGNFIGEHLKVVEETVSLIKNTFISGKSLEEFLSDPPCGYSYGVINTTLAVLFRSGKLIVKYNGAERFDYSDPDVLKVFTSSREFEKASFKAISKTLSASNKNEIIQSLLDIKAKDILEKEIGYNTNDFELIDTITIISNKLIDLLRTLHKNTYDFEKYFPDYSSLISFFKEFTDKTTEGNYLDKADLFLQKNSDFVKSVKKIKSIDQFVQKKLPAAKKFQQFVGNVISELNKIGGSYKQSNIFNYSSEFDELFNNSLTDKYSEIEKKVQQIKDEYYRIFEKEHKMMASSHQELLSKCKSTLSKIESVSIDLNADLIQEANSLIDYTQKRICNHYDIGYEHTCKNCAFSMYEAVSSIEAVQLKQYILIDIESRIRTKPEQPVTAATKKKPIKIKLRFSSGEITVAVYKKQLLEQLNNLERLSAGDTIELDIQIEGK
ncbi:MAG: hypothetical protein K8H86_06015, partial [Ignavibacteriaceae bacterium]|nr:hypothetical protein [Ignavibacteriaceae bacterium]